MAERRKAGARHGAAGAVRAAGLRQAQPQAGAAALEPAGRPVPGARARALLPAAGGRALRLPAARAPAEARADRDDRRQRRRQLRGHHVRLADGRGDGRGGRRRRPRVPHRARGDGRDAALGRGRGARRQDRPGPAERADGRRRLARRARGALVPVVGARRGPSARPSRRAARASRRSRRRSRAPAPTPGAPRARRWPSRSSTAGVSEDFARRHAYLPELVHAPDIVVVARQTGRPVPDVARVFYLLGEALHLDWLESRLDDLPAVSRWQRWAMQAIEDDLTLVRREIAQKAIETAPGARRRTRRSRPTWRRVPRRPSACRGSCAAWRSRASPTSRC